MRAFAFGLACVLFACEAKRTSWGALPTTETAARDLVERSTTRPMAQRAPDVDVRAAIDGGQFVVGFDAIDDAIAKRLTASNAILLFGTKHDSVAQIEAFRRLIGPRSRTAWTRIVVEQLHATGRWDGIDWSAQRGDEDALVRGDYKTLAATLEKDVYTTWKFGEVDALVDLLAVANASGRAVSGCDMGAALQAKLGAAREPFGLRLRELHCANALREGMTNREAPQRVAAMWGSLHVEPDGFVRFLPADWSVVALRVVEAPANVVLVDPILSGDTMVLATPDAAKHFERKRTTGSPAKPLPSGVKIDAAKHAVVANIGERVLVAAIDDANVEIEVASDAPEVTVTTFRPTRD